MKVERFLRERQIIITLGTGGVGKTSISAALACASGMLGQKSIVLTVDPAKRLASALGLKMKEEIVEVVSEKSRFFASMLDLKRSLDRLVKEYAPSKYIAESVLNSRIYRIVSRSVAGSQEYVSAERLYEIYRSGEYDTIILDTPPAYEAVDFLKAPERVTEFFSDRFLRWFVGPLARVASMSFDVAINKMPRVFRPLIELTGAEFLKEFFDFVSLASNLFEDMSKRTEEVLNMLRSRRTSFIYVTHPIPDAFKDFEELRKTLKEMRLNLDAIILNRFQPVLTTPEERKLIEKENPSSPITMLAEYYRRRREIHENVLQSFKKQRSLTVLTVEEIPEGIKGIEGLTRIAESLLSG